jgi:electron transport complex protein RnfE
LFGSGTLFANAALLLGTWASFLELTLIPDYKGFLLIILPPGGFIVLGFILAGKRLIDRVLTERKRLRDEVDAAVSTT